MPAIIGPPSGIIFSIIAIPMAIGLLSAPPLFDCFSRSSCSSGSSARYLSIVAGRLSGRLFKDRAVVVGRQLDDAHQLGSGRLDGRNDVGRLHPDLRLRPGRLAEALWPRPREVIAALGVEPGGDTTTASGRLVFGIFAALAEFERELIRERTIAGLSSARARGRNGGRPYRLTPAKLRLAQAAMAKRDTKVGDLCDELGVTRQTLYRFVSPKGELRADGTKLLKRKGQNLSS